MRAHLLPALAAFKFNFNGIFDQSTTQKQIFDSIGRKVIDNVTAGYNGQQCGCHA